MIKCKQCEKVIKKTCHNKLFCNLPCRNKYYSKLPKIKEYRTKYEKLDKTIQRRRLYRQSERGKEIHKNASQKYRTIHADRIKAYTKIYNKTEKAKIKNKKYWISDKAKEMHKRFRQTDKYKNAVKKYQQSEKGRINALLSTSKRRSIKKNIIEIFKKEEVGAMLSSECITCGTVNKLTIDHIIPLSQSEKEYIHQIGMGQYDIMPPVYTINDIQPLCISCNSKKGISLEGGY